jgi:hypothetical protein
VRLPTGSGQDSRATAGRVQFIGLAALVPVLVLLALLATDLWVYMDAKTQAEHGVPVAFTWGSFKVDTPTEWFVACLLLSILFIPLYLVGRGH